MIFINELLPNPVGADAKGEFIELWNNGTAPVNLNGWILRTDAKKRFKLSGMIDPNGYLLLPRSETKLSLKNTDGKIFLYDAVGAQVDQSAFDGSAPEGESFNRVGYRADANSAAIQQFVWGKPTPGTKNGVAAETNISEAYYRTGISLNSYSLNGVSVAGLSLFTGMIFAAILWYAMKRDKYIAQLFFGGDEDFRR